MGGCEALDGCKTGGRSELGNRECLNTPKDSQALASGTHGKDE